MIITFRLVWFDPILPFINDTEENLRGILNYCYAAGVYGIIFFGIGLTLREGNREYFYQKLDEHFPGLKEKYQQKYGDSYPVMSDKNEALSRLFHAECKRMNIVSDVDKVFEYLHKFEARPKVIQMDLFE